MPKTKGSTVWGAYDISFEKVLRETVEKLEQLGIPSPTKKEASALIAFRQNNNLSFMTEKQIKEFIMKNRGFIL